MNFKKIIWISIAVMLLITFILFRWFPDQMQHPFERKRKPAKMHQTLYDIVNAGKMTVITRNDAHCYYLYRDEPMGFEYDLISEFADYLGVRMNLRFSVSWDGIVRDLSDGEGAIAAAGLTITPERKKTLDFSDGYMTVRQQVITRRNYPEIRSAHDLAGKTVHVRKGTSYHEMLRLLIHRGIPIKLALHDEIPTEELIRQAAEGVIDITVANSNIALLNRRYYPDIRISAAISDEQELGWAISRFAPKLKDRVNNFLRIIRRNGKYDEIYHKYYSGVEHFDYGDMQDFHEKLSTTLPLYIDRIQKDAEAAGFDWRLIAAMIYQESRYNPNSCSNSGACGLMQLTKTAARNLKVTDVFNPEQNISAGIRHLKELYDLFDNAEGVDRLYLALAAYNAGQGHILDARNIAKERNINPDKWASLEKILPLLAKREVYEKTVYGYCRGTETVEYLKKIKGYFDILKQLHVNETARS